MTVNTKVVAITGCTSGLDRRIEINLWDLDGSRFITGPPGRGGRYANVLANPAFTLRHDDGTWVPAIAEPILDPDGRHSSG